MQQGLQAVGAVIAGEQLVGQSSAVLGGAGADKRCYTKGLQLLGQGAHAIFLVAVLRQADALRGGAGALPHLGHIAQIIVKKGHNFSLAFQTEIVP